MELTDAERLTIDLLQERHNELLRQHNQRVQRFLAGALRHRGHPGAGPRR